MAIGNFGYAGTGHLNGDGSDEWYPDWWEYNPATDSWTQKADYPGNNGLGDQDIVAIGFDNVGYAGLGQWDNNSFFKFDPALNLWTQVASPPAAYNFRNTFPFRIGEYGYFPTLYDTGFFRYDPANDTWMQLGPLPQSTLYGIPTFAVGGKGYIKYGQLFWEYDPTIDDWQQKTDFPGQYPHRPRGIHQNGYGFFIGGYSGSPSVLPWIWEREVWRYDPTNDQWLRMDDFQGSIRRWAVIMNIQGRVFYGLGTNGTNFNDIWEFSSVGGLEENMTATFDVFPTLSTDIVNFVDQENGKFEVIIYNTSGQEISKIQADNGTAIFNRTVNPSGNYHYRISRDKKLLSTGKFILQ
jgi:N-acetylneuraminic acid mutarotase